MHTHSIKTSTKTLTDYLSTQQSNSIENNIARTNSILNFSYTPSPTYQINRIRIRKIHSSYFQSEYFHNSISPVTGKVKITLKKKTKKSKSSLKPKEYSFLIRKCRRSTPSSPRSPSKKQFILDASPRSHATPDTVHSPDNSCFDEADSLHRAKGNRTREARVPRGPGPRERSTALSNRCEHLGNFCPSRWGGMRADQTPINITKMFRAAHKSEHVRGIATVG